MISWHNEAGGTPFGEKGEYHRFLTSILIILTQPGRHVCRHRFPGTGVTLRPRIGNLYDGLMFFPNIRKVTGSPHDRATALAMD